jgi:hypothetical protein
MKGQTQAVTTVLITGVILASVVSAYVWGVPLIEKREGQAEVQSLESSMMRVEETIDSVAESGQGTSRDVELDLDRGNIKVNSTENFIQISTTASGASYPQNGWKLLRGENRQGLSIGSGIYGSQGEDSAGVVAAKSADNAVSIGYRIEFRNMRVSTPSGSELRQIDLQASGPKRAEGDATLRFMNEGVEQDEGAQGVELSSGDKIDRSRTVVSVDLR